MLSERKNWTPEEIQQVWDKGNVVQGVRPEEWRKDDCTAWIKRDEYGNRNSDYGWEIDHLGNPENNDISNLRPLQWDNNASKKCVVISSSNKNTRKIS